MLKLRILTAVVLLPLTILAIVYLPVAGFAGVAAILLALAAWEWASLVGLTCYVQKIIYVLCFLLLLLIPALRTYPLLIFALLGWLFVAIWISAYPLGRRIWQSNRILRLMVGLWLLIPCWTGLLLLRQQPGGMVLMLLLLALVWSADSGAYFVGRYCGKKPLARQVSPKKTQEGVYGGLLCALIITVGLGWFFLRAQVLLPLYAVLVLATAVLSILGDLFESMVKRMAEVKDSGSILPGHGGVLDRLDSLTAAAPVFSLGMELLFRLNAS